MTCNFFLVEDNSNIYPHVLKPDYEKLEGAHFTCYSVNVPRWFFNPTGTKMNIEEICTGNDLTYSEVALKHTGVYYCYGTDINIKKPFVASAMIKVICE